MCGGQTPPSAWLSGRKDAKLSDREREQESSCAFFRSGSILMSQVTVCCIENCGNQVACRSRPSDVTTWAVCLSPVGTCYTICGPWRDPRGQQCRPCQPSEACNHHRQGRQAVVKRQHATLDYPRPTYSIPSLAPLFDSIQCHHNFTDIRKLTIGLLA